MKYYEFKFKLKSYESFDGFGSKLINFIIPFFIFAIVVGILYHIPLSNFWWFSIAVKISFFICFVIAILLVHRYKEKPKGVFLYDNYIDIDRNSISRWHFSKMNYTINIKDVECCEIQKDNASNFGIRYYDTMGGIDDSFVMIRTNDNKTFCFCLENQEEFVENVTTRANEYRRKNGLEEI